MDILERAASCSHSGISFDLRQRGRQDGLPAAVWWKPSLSVQRRRRLNRANDDCLGRALGMDTPLVATIGSDGPSGDNHGAGQSETLSKAPLALFLLQLLLVAYLVFRNSINWHVVLGSVIVTLIIFYPIIRLAIPEVGPDGGFELLLLSCV